MFHNKFKTPEFLLDKRKLGFLAGMWPSISLCLSRAGRRTASAKRSFFLFQNYPPPAPSAWPRCPLTCIRDQSLHLLSQINSHCSRTPTPVLLHSHPTPCIHNSLPCTQQRTSSSRSTPFIRLNARSIYLADENESGPALTLSSSHFSSSPSRPGPFLFTATIRGLWRATEATGLGNPKFNLLHNWMCFSTAKDFGVKVWAVREGD